MLPAHHWAKPLDPGSPQKTAGYAIRAHLCALAIAATALSLPAEAIADPSPRNAISAAKAGKIFAALCYDIYPDVPAAQKTAQRKGYRYNAQTKLFEHVRKDQQMRINSKRCGLRFLTKDAPPKLGATFGAAATNAAKSLPEGLKNVDIDVQRVGNGLFRASAKWDR